MSTYDAEIDLDSTNDSHAEVIRLVGRDQRVLDVGCWKGDLGRALATRGCRVSGLDVDESAAVVARQHLDEVVVADLDRVRLSECFPAGSFDVLVLADVLEHLRDPAAVLSDAAALLAPGGRVVLSIPNITHGSVRLALAQGLWDYTDTGLLDRTHVMFFSRRGVVDLTRRSGFAIDVLGATVADVLVGSVRHDPRNLPRGLVEWVRAQPDALVYQFLVSARPSEDAGSAAVPPLTPSVPLHSVRGVDRYSSEAQVTVERAQQVLTQRDHVLGLEATAAASVQRAAEAEKAERALRRRLDRKNANIATLRGELTAARRRLRRLTASTPPPPARLTTRVVARLRRR